MKLFESGYLLVFISLSSVCAHAQAAWRYVPQAVAGKAPVSSLLQGGYKSLPAQVEAVVSRSVLRGAAHLSPEVQSRTLQQIRLEEKLRQDRAWQRLEKQEIARKKEIFRLNATTQALSDEAIHAQALRYAAAAEGAVPFPGQVDPVFVNRLISYYNYLDPYQTGLVELSQNAAESWLNKLEVWLKVHKRFPSQQGQEEERALYFGIRDAIRYYGEDSQLPAVKKLVLLTQQWRPYRSPEDLLQEIKSFISTHHRWPASSGEEDPLHRAAYDFMRRHPDSAITAELSSLLQRYWVSPFD